MNGCNEYKILMNKLLDREISAGEKASLEQHIGFCSSCARGFKAVQSGLDALISMPVPDPSVEFTSETVRNAFRVKRNLIRRHRVIYPGLVSLVAMISALLIEGWSLVFEPVIRWMLLRAVECFSKCSVLLTAVDKMVSVVSSVLWVLGRFIYGIVCSGCNPGLMLLAALLVMIFCFLMARGRASAFSLDRR